MSETVVPAKIVVERSRDGVRILLRDLAGTRSRVWYDGPLEVFQKIEISGEGLTWSISEEPLVQALLRQG